MFSNRPEIAAAFYSGEVVIAAGDISAEVEFQQLLASNEQHGYFSDVGDALAEMAHRTGRSTAALSTVRDGFIGVVEFARLDNRLPEFGFYFYVADTERVKALLPHRPASYGAARQSLALTPVPV